MTIDEFIAHDPQESLTSTYRMVDRDICVSVVRRNGDMPTYMMDHDVQTCLDKDGLTAYYAVLDLKNVFWAGPDARNWIKGEMAARVVKGYALIIDGPLRSLIADAWVRTVSLPFPVKKFKDYREGLEWVRSLKAAERDVA